MKHKNNVAKYRKAIGKTQRQLATDAEVSEISIQNIEAGKQEPKISLAKKIAKSIGKTVEEIF